MINLGYILIPVYNEIKKISELGFKFKEHVQGFKEAAY